MSMINWAELQLAIMSVLWQKGEATVHEVIADLSSEKPPAYTTVLTVLTNLSKQGMVSHEARPGTRMFAYRACVSQAEIQTGITNELIDRLYDCHPASLIIQLLQSHTFEEAALQEIAQQLQSHMNSSSPNPKDANALSLPQPD